MIPAWLRRNGLTIVTVVLGGGAAIAGLAGSAVGVAVGVFGVLASGAGQMYVTESSASAAAQQRAEAMRSLGTEARRFERRIAGAPAFGGTSVLDDCLQVDLRHLGEEIRACRFNFAPGQRQYQWADLADVLRSGARDFLAAVGAIADVPSSELARARALADVGTRAARRAYAVASAYAGFDVDREPGVMKYRGPDAPVDLPGLTVYRDLGEDVVELAGGLERLGAFAPEYSIG